MGAAEYRKATLKLLRERAVIKSSDLPEMAKQKMLADMDAEIEKIGKQMELEIKEEPKKK